MIRQIEGGDTKGGIIFRKIKFTSLWDLQKKYVEGKSVR